MLQSKDINKIAELKNGFTLRWLEPDFILSSLTCFSFSAVCKHLNPFKQRGYSFETVFSCLISLPFLGLQSVYSFTNNALSTHIQAKKDVFYRMKNNQGICWRNILWMFGMKFIKLTDTRGGESDSPKCLIFDDSDLPKTGRYIEKVSRSMIMYPDVLFLGISCWPWATGTALRLFPWIFLCTGSGVRMRTNLLV